MVVIGLVDELSFTLFFSFPIFFLELGRVLLWQLLLLWVGFRANAFGLFPAQEKVESGGRQRN